MKRTKVTAIVAADAGNTIVAERTTFAWSSAIRATEAIVREYARERTTIMSGSDPQVMGTPARPGSIYRRRWTSTTGRELSALVYAADS